MKCPFRQNVLFEYVQIEAKTKDAEDSFLEHSQRSEFADCYEGDCPFYDYAGDCKRVEVISNE